MKISTIISLFAVLIMCYSELTFQIPNLSRPDNEAEISLIKNDCKFWSCDEETINKMQLDRKKKSTNRTEAETAYRIASSAESWNLTNSTNTSTVNKHALLIKSFKQIWPVSKWREYGFFSDDYLDLINEHWLQFAPPSESLQKSLGGFYVMFTTLGCWGNIIVLLMYLRVQQETAKGSYQTSQACSANSCLVYKIMIEVAMAHYSRIHKKSDSSSGIY